MADTSSLRLSLITLWAASCICVLQPCPWLARSWCSIHAMCAHVLLNRQLFLIDPFPQALHVVQAPSWRGPARIRHVVSSCRMCRITSLVRWKYSPQTQKSAKGKPEKSRSRAANPRIIPLRRLCTSCQTERVRNPARRGAPFPGPNRSLASRSVAY